MMSARRRLLAAAAAAAMWATFPPDTVSAQQSGVGGDESTVLRWVGTAADGTADVLVLWKLDANLNFLASKGYGPYPGFTPLAITTANNGDTFVLWTYRDHSIVLWKVDPNLNYLTSKAYGPYPGWAAQGLSVDTGQGLNGSNVGVCLVNCGIPSFRVTWANANGSANVWELDQNLNYITSHVYGPYPGYGVEALINTPVPPQ
jgi:hypothetical protein